MLVQPRSCLWDGDWDGWHWWMDEMAWGCLTLPLSYYRHLGAWRNHSRSQEYYTSSQGHYTLPCLDIYLHELVDEIWSPRPWGIHIVSESHISYLWSHRLELELEWVLLFTFSYQQDGMIPPSYPYPLTYVCAPLMNNRCAGLPNWILRHAFVMRAIRKPKRILYARICWCGISFFIDDCHH